MRRFTRETPQATQSGYSPHSAQAQTHAQDWHKQQQQELLNQKMAEFTAQRVLHYYGNFSHPSNTVPPILVKAAPDIVRSTKAGLLIRNLYNPPGTTDHHVTLLPWHRVHELILHPNDPLHRDL